MAAQADHVDATVEDAIVMAAPAVHVDATVEDAIVPFRNNRARRFAKKVIDGIGGKTIDEAKAEREARKEQITKEVQEMVTFEKTMAVQAEEAMAEFNQVHEEVSAKIDEEVAAAVKFRELRAAKQVQISKTGALRGELFEAMKKIAVLEMLSSSRATAKDLQEKAEAATKAAQEVNRQIVEEKKLQKEKLEATRRAWTGMDKKGAKRVTAAACEADAEEPSSKRPMLEGKQIPSPAVSQSTPKRGAFEAEECEDNIHWAATMVDDAQAPETLCEVGDLD